MSSLDSAAAAAALQLSWLQAPEVLQLLPQVSAVCSPEMVGVPTEALTAVLGLCVCVQRPADDKRRG